MSHTKIALLIAAVFALTLTVQEARSASFNTLGALKQTTVGTDLVHKASGCHTNCRWRWYRAGDGKIYLGCHRNTGRAHLRRLATLEPAAGGAGGTDKQVERLSLGRELGPAFALLSLTFKGRDALFLSLG
jgi:hypothetical protein